MAGGGTAVLNQVLSGTGGVGKTQLAAEFARNAWKHHRVDVLVWISAGSRSAVTSGYAQAATEVLGRDFADPEQAADAFLAWLEPKAGKQGCRWLIVLDDLADPADLRGLWPPLSPSGCALITTRRRDAALSGDTRRLVPVGLFTPEEASSYLLRVLTAHDRQEAEAELAELAADLGHLPLALSQAAAYLVDAALDCAAYRALLAERATRLTDMVPEPAALPDDQMATVAAAWSLSIERADTLRPAGLARPMLEMAAMLDANGIPGSVITASPALAYLTARRSVEIGPGTDRTHRRSEDVSAAQATDALRVLHRLNLIDHSPATPHLAVRVHRLLQHAVRDTIEEGRTHQLAHAVAGALSEVWPELEGATPLAGALRANAVALERCAGEELWRPEAHPLLFRLGAGLGECGQVAAAVTFHGHLVDTAQRVLGPLHRSTLLARHNLAHWRGQAGDVAGAAQAYARLLPDQAGVLGPDHPDTLSNRNQHADLLGASGDVEGAIAACTELLADRERALGPDHPDTLVSAHNLAHWRGAAGDVAGATESYVELLHRVERVLGADHPSTLLTRSTLAHWWGEAGDTDRAAGAYAQMLPDYERVLGPDHPSTLMTRSALAQWRGESGDADGAARAYADMLPDYERVLGPDHPSTLAVRGGLARWTGNAGQKEDAVDEYAELLADHVRILGQDHPQTLIIQQQLAHWRGKAGDTAGAIAAFTSLLPEQIRVLGPDHPEVVVTRNNLAHAQGEAGDAAGAAVTYAELARQAERIMGPRHPHTLGARHNLAHWRGMAGDAAGAVTAYAGLLEQTLAVLGPDHPQTLATRYSFARWRGEAGDVTGAVEAFAGLLPHRERILGPDHPETIRTRTSLDRWRMRRGQPSEPRDG
ncbi:FxSxx-COOH system tetratricopeptide repeat protein [Streptomyces sp. NPDC006175]|uniref:FxSxx-COOH system tetratricopeptide repeat protein n=1 Tax=Streptomyces sp. NPDC006175 TaxID=3154471 RepID=UPI0033A9D58D